MQSRRLNALTSVKPRLQQLLPPESRRGVGKPSATATGTGATDLEPVATEVSPVTSALSPEVIEMIVNKVADEVSRRSSLPNAAGVFRNDTDLADVPFTCVDPSPTSTSLVQESLTTVQQDLSGERIGSRQPIPRSDCLCHLACRWMLALQIKSGQKYGTRNILTLEPSFPIPN